MIIDEIKKIIDSDEISCFRANRDGHYGGKYVQELEDKICELTGAKYAVSCNSGTSGLMMACYAAKIKDGDEVIVTPYSMTCTATVPKMLGAKLVFCDIEERYFGIDVSRLESLVTDKTKAIMATGLFGNPVHEFLKDFADRKGLTLIEDACQSLGGINAGRIGHIGVFSFTTGKTISCGEGGVCVTDDLETAQRLCDFRNHGESVENTRVTNRAWIYGLNLRMSEIHALITSERLSKLLLIKEKRQSNADIIRDYINETNGVITVPDYDKSALWKMPLLVDRHFNAKKIVEDINEKHGKNIVQNGYITPLPDMPFFKYKDMPCARSINKRMILINNLDFPNLVAEDIGLCIKECVTCQSS